MKRLIGIIAVLIVALLSFGIFHHRSVRSLDIPNEVSANWCSGGSGCQQPGNPACNQTPWQSTNQLPGGNTLSLSSPALGTNCTKHVISSMAATIYDSSEPCVQSVVIEDGSTVIWRMWLGDVASVSAHSVVASFPSTSFLHSNTDGTQTLQIVGLGPTTSGTLTLAFGGNCANSSEILSFTGFDE